ncbi:MAG TPA: RNA polymerase sigma factor SigM [Streptosporangiaceae bacterium]|nr:RNA polymerase sigma factor SigM [Streptosporangiaceae bacterium]
MTRHPNRDELARPTLLAGPGERRQRRVEPAATPSAISRPSTASQPIAPAHAEDPSDTELLSLHVSGDPRAFGELFRRHRDRLWAVAVRTLSDPDEAADALQDAMIAALRRADSFRGDSAVTTWLHRIVVNAALDRARRRAVRPTTGCRDEDTLDALATGRQSLQDPSDGSDTAIDVRAALQQLVPEQQAALVLVDMLGYSVTDASQVLGVSEGTVKSRAARGRARLLPRLKHLRPASVPEQGRQNRQNRPTARRRLPASQEVAGNSYEVAAHRPAHQCCAALLRSDASAGPSGPAPIVVPAKGQPNALASRRDDHDRR